MYIVVLIISFVSFISLLSSSMESNNFNNRQIPTATVVSDADRLLERINKKINEITNKIEQINPSLAQYNNFNLQNSAKDLETTVKKLKEYVKNTDTLNYNIMEFNNYLKPISILANNKNVASEIDSKRLLKEQEFNELMTLSKMKSEHDKISEWDAYKSITSNNNLFYCSIVSFAAGAFTVLLINKSNYNSRL